MDHVHEERVYSHDFIRDCIGAAVIDATIMLLNGRRQFEVEHESVRVLTE